MNDTTDVATVDRHVWATLKNSLYPGAKDESIKMVLSYCLARGLDPMKKPCHIVPMYVNKVNGQGKEWRDVVFPGIYELRTTAQKTGDYMGQDKAVFKDDFDYLGESVPRSCEMTVHRWHEKSNSKINYSAEVFFTECAGTKTEQDSGIIKLNARWAKAPRQMIEKCAEAAALRRAFPDELGGQMAAEEMHSAAMEDTPAIGKPKTRAPQAASQTVPSGTTVEGEAEPADDEKPTLCSKAQASLVTKRLDESGIPERDFLKTFKIDHVDFLPANRVDDALAWMKALTEPPD